MKEIYKINVPADCQMIIDKMYENGYEAFVVGGCVRDSILGVEPKDWDITTNSPPDKTIEIFREQGFKVIETGLKHGTVTVMIQGEPYEITTYRIEGEYENNRTPSNVEFTSSLEEDLKRRDFTMNALAYNHREGIQDFFNGISDIKQGVIKCVGNPEERFNEDALRMLRAVRFSSRLGFVIEENTYKGLKLKASLIDNISRERIREELNKVLISDRAVDGIRCLVESGLMEYIIPELSICIGFDQKNKYHDKDVYEHILGVVGNTPADIEIRIAALLHDIGKPECFTEDESGGHFYGHEIESSEIAESIMKRLKYENKTVENVKMLVKEHMFKGSVIKRKAIKRLISRIGEVNVFKLFILQKADCMASHPEHSSTLDIEIMREKAMEIIRNKEVLRTSDLAIGGRDLIEMGISPGPEIGKILNELLEICLESTDMNRRGNLIEILKSREIIKS